MAVGRGGRRGAALSLVCALACALPQGAAEPPRPPDSGALGSVVLLKLARSPVARLSPERGLDRLGLPALDRDLAVLGASVLPALPILDPESAERSGLARWVVLDLPPGVDPAEVILRLWSHGDVEPGSLRFEDPIGLRSPRFGTSLVRVSEAVAPPRSPPLRTAPRRAPPPSTREVAPRLRALRAPEAWSLSTGRGIGIAIVDSGLDRNHVALAGQLRSRLGDDGASDHDGNGIPGDLEGVSLAHLAIVRAPGGTYLALASPDDWSDWDSVQEGRMHWGHGTTLASAAAGSGEAGGPIGVAPGAWLLPVDVQENLSPSLNSGVAPDRRSLPARRVDRAALAPLRSSDWLRALGVVYAVREGARVLTCAWGQEPLSPLLSDALRYAEESCTVAVCAPASLPESDGLLRVAPSDPRNDATPLPDRRVARRADRAVAIGLTAGAAALLLAERPDLAPEQIHRLLDARPELDLIGALRAARSSPRGRCEGAAPREPLWRGRLADPTARRAP